MKILHAKNLSFQFQDKKIFSKINLEIHKWDFIWIFWENWAGKTTLIQLLLWILRPSQWNIYWYNIDGKITTKNIFNIEYISQKSQMIESGIPITVKEFLWLGQQKKQGVFQEKNTSCNYWDIETSLKHVHMSEYINTPFRQLSWWQKQRILIAKALLSHPDMIIMDEATAGVDMMNQQHFYNLLSHLNTTHNITILLISHDINFIQNHIKKVWYVGGFSTCNDCKHPSVHLEHIKKIFHQQTIDFI